MSKILFEVTGLTKHFGGLAAVDGLDFHINQGEIFSIIGPNGSGKTTVFNVITGVYSPTRGKVTYSGEDITNLKPFTIARKGIVRTFQQTTVFAGETVIDNVIVGHRLRTKSGIFGGMFGSHRAREEERMCQEKAKEVLEFVELTARQNQIAGSINQEAQKRLSIGLALATDPKLILLDEPAGGVNLQEIGGLISLIGRIRDRGITVCLIEHKMRMVMNISDRIIALNYGRKIAEGSASEVSSDKGVIQAYLGERYAA